MTVRISYDGSGSWMAALKNSGVDMSMLFGRLDVAQCGEPHWYSLPHSECDGIGAFTTLLRENGHPDLNTLPHQQGDRPSLLKLLRAGVRFATLPIWRSGSAAFGARKSAPQPGSVAWHVFDGNETSELVARAKQEGVGINSLLLFAFAQAVEPFLDPPGSSARWMIPVNMRGLVRGPRETANHVSYVRIQVSHLDSPQSIQDKIRLHLERNEHWWLWYCYQYGSLIGPWGMRTLVRADMRWGKSLIGSFSNLGNWDLSGPHSWICCPPVAETMPVGVGCVTYGGRLGLALQIHPNYEDANVLAETTMKNWVRQLDA